MDTATGHFRPDDLEIIMTRSFLTFIALSTLTLSSAANAELIERKRPAPKKQRSRAPSKPRTPKVVKKVGPIDMAKIATAVKKHRGEVVYSSPTVAKPWVAYVATAAPTNQTVKVKDFLSFTVNDNGKPDGGATDMVPCLDSTPGDQRITMKKPEKTREFPDKLLCLYAAHLDSPEDVTIVQPNLQFLKEHVLPPSSDKNDELFKWLVREMHMDPKAYGKVLLHELYTLGDVQTIDSNLSLRTDSFHQFSLLPEGARQEQIEKQAKAKKAASNKPKEEAVDWVVSLLQLLGLMGLAWWLALNPWRKKFRPRKGKLFAWTGTVAVMIAASLYFVSLYLGCFIVGLIAVAYHGYKAYKDVSSP